MKKILFVCLGNICRSSSAEGVMLHLLEERGLSSDFVIDSAGTSGYHNGDLPDSRMRKHAQLRGYDLVHRSRKVQVEDFYEFDYIIGMDDKNIADLHTLCPSLLEEKKIHRMVEFSSQHDNLYVPDPYYGGSDGFELVLDLLEDACEGLLNSLTRDS